MLEHYKREHCKRLMSKLTNIVLGCHLVVFIFLQKDIVYFDTEQFVCIPVCVCVCVCVCAAAFDNCQSIWWQISRETCIQQPWQCSHLSWQLHGCGWILPVSLLQVVCIVTVSHRDLSVCRYIDVNTACSISHAMLSWYPQPTLDVLPSLFGDSKTYSLHVLIA